jgi:CheY-like chemotaxis protein
MAAISCTLLVDDDATTNYLNQRLLQRLQVTDSVLVAAGNGQEALDLLHTHCQQLASPTCPTLILLDMKMPRMNGFELLQAYAQRLPPENPAVVIIMLTTSLKSQDVAQMQNLPIAGYLTKPLTTDKIQQILHKHFGLSAPTVD